MNKKNLKLAIQKDGRLTKDSLDFLRLSGLEFDSFSQKLFSRCRNFPLEILYVRDNDILKYVTSKAVDLGVIGQNTLNEKMIKVKKLFNLQFGFCSLCVAVPKESQIKNLDDLKNNIIATSYPNSTKFYFNSRDIPVKLISLSGSVEIAPNLGIAQAIVDLVSSGSTIALNDLRILEKIYDSEAVLITNNKTNSNLLESLLVRFKAVLSARNYKFVQMDLPMKNMSKAKKIIPSITLSNSIAQAVIKEDYLWEIINRLKSMGAQSIIVLPIEKMIV